MFEIRHSRVTELRRNDILSSYYRFLPSHRLRKIVREDCFVTNQIKVTCKNTVQHRMRRCRTWHALIKLRLSRPPPPNSALVAVILISVMPSSSVTYGFSVLCVFSSLLFASAEWCVFVLINLFAALLIFAVFIMLSLARIISLFRWWLVRSES